MSFKRGLTLYLVVVFAAILVFSGAVDASNAVTAYRSNTSVCASGLEDPLNCPKVRFFNVSGTGSWGGEVVLPSAGSPVRETRIKYSPVSSKLVLVTESDDGQLDGYACFDNCNVSSSWTVNSDIARVWNGSVATHSRRFDFSFESTTGDVVLTYGVVNATTSCDLGYRVMNASSYYFSNEMCLDDLGHSLDIQYSWVVGNAKNASQEIIFAGFDINNSDINAWVWNGNSFGNQIEVSGSATATSGREALAVQYSSEGTKGMVLGADGTAGLVNYIFWNGISWSSPANFDIDSSELNDTNWITLKADPASDDLQAVIIDSGSDLNAAYWNGTTWNVGSNLDEVLDVNSRRSADFAWLPQGGSGYLIWDTDGSGSNLSTILCSPLCSLSIVNYIPYIATARWNVLYTNPTLSDKTDILGLRMNSNSDSGAFVYNGTNFSNFGDARLTADTTSAGNVYESFSAAFQISTASEEPSVQFISPTPANASLQSSSSVVINVSASDNLGFGNCTLIFDSAQYSMQEFGSGTSKICSLFLSGLSAGRHDFNVTVSDNGGSQTRSETRYFTINSPPDILVVNPLNQTYNFSVLNLDYWFNDSDSTSCWYSLDLGASNSSFVSCGFNFSGISASQGTNRWTVYINDTANNQNFSRITFFVDSIVPGIDFNGATLANGSVVSQHSIFASVSINEANLANLTYTLRDANGILNQTTYARTNITWNNLADGVYLYSVSIQDIVGNTNNTEERTVNLSTVIPLINVHSPLNTTYTTNQILVNITSTGIETWYFDGSANVSYTSPALHTFGEGTTRMIAYTNDSAGNSNSSSVTFFIDSLAPQVTIISPTQGSVFGVNTSLSLNYSAVDVNRAGCWYSLDFGPNITLNNCQNTTFDVSAGSHFVSVFANDTLGNIGGQTSDFSVELGGPSIALGNPVNNSYLNYTNVTFTYTPSDIDLRNCTLFGDFNGTYGSISTNTSVVSGQQSSFFYSLNEGSYLWSILCRDAAGNSNSGRNRTLNIDLTVPVVSIVSPSGTYTSQTGIPFDIDSIDASPLYCVYNITYAATGEIALSNTNVPGCSDSSFNLAVESDYVINLRVNDSAGNFAYANNTFSVDIPAAGGDSGSGGGGGGGGGDGGTVVGTARLTLTPIPSTIVKRGDNKLISLTAKNTGTRFLNRCALTATGDFASWVSSDQIESFSPGEETTYEFTLNVPRDLRTDSFSIPLNVACAETRTSTNLNLRIASSDFDFIILSSSREGNRLSISYRLTDFSGKEQKVDVSYALVDLDGVEINSGTQSTNLGAGEDTTETLLVDLPIDSQGQYQLQMSASNGIESTDLSQDVIIPAGTGLAIFGENGSNLSIFAAIVIFGIIFFFIGRALYHHHKKVKAEGSGRMFFSINRHH